MDFDRRARSQPERTRREDRRLKFYELRDNLFLSPRTVEWHLHKVFTKLGMRSRRELSEALPASDSEVVPA